MNLSACSQTLLSLIIANDKLDIEQLRELVMPLAIDLGLAGGDWVDHLQPLLDQQFVVRVAAVNGYVYAATPLGQKVFAAFMTVEPRRAAS